MNIAESLLPEFDHEMTNTRRMLERVPNDRLDWGPHAKSMTLGGLATHIANLPTWAISTMGGDSFDMNPADGEGAQMETTTTTDEALALFDKNVAQARAALAAADDAAYMSPWTLKSGGDDIFTMPRVGVIRNFVMNHIVHHRAQLGVYLRMNDVPLPMLYGPTADEA